MTTGLEENGAAQAVQKQIDDIQEELHSCVQKIITKANATKNSHYAKRNAVIAKAIHDGHLPSSFWADAIIAVFTTQEAEKGGDGGSLLGPYDAHLLRTYMTGFQVEYTSSGVKVLLSFKSNPFFEETELWAETVQDLPDKDGESDHVDNCRFSGITWRPGHGPTDEDGASDSSKGDGSADNKSGNGRKHERPAQGGTRGWSFLETFSKMLPHPEDDEQLDDEEEDIIFEAAEQWEAEMDDRRDLLQMLVDDVWADPVAAIRSAGDEPEACEPPKQRQKVE